MKVMRTALAALFLATAPAAASTPRPEVALTREGGVFRLQASFIVDAPPGVVWGVLTDYDGMTRFLSSLKRSRVLEKKPGEAVIEQEGSARLLMFSRAIKLVLKVAELPPARIEFKDISDKEFDEYDGSWTVKPAAGGTSVSYQLFAEMKASLVPRAVARRVLEKSVRRQLEELSAEMLKRAQAGKPEAR
jgi:hypothetical protein